MIDKKEFSDIRKDLDGSENNRESSIQVSRNVIKLSKLIIYSIHRNNLNETNKLISKIKEMYRELIKNPYDICLYNIAVQEYVEALCFFEFIKNKKLPNRKELNADTENYLMGLCDLTGELVRKAVDDAINSKFKHLEEIREFVNDIYGEFLKFNLGNGELRKKYDAIKWNLNKIEDVLYDVKIRKKS